MSAPVIHLEEYYLEKVLIERIHWKEDTAVDTITIAYDHDYKVQRNADNPNVFALTFIVRDNPATKTPTPQAYKLDLRIIGFFRFNEGIEEKQMQYLIRYNGCAILYGILRGMLATMTGAFPEGAIRMPTIMVDEIVKKVEAQNAPKAPKKKATKKAAKKAVKKTTRSAAKNK
jgi:preprotein translocase subunit SecB